MNRTSRIPATVTDGTMRQAQLVAALDRMSDQLARATGWPDATTRLAALREMEAIGDALVSSQIARGRGVASADVIQDVVLAALTEQQETTRGPREITARVRELSGVAARRTYERYERRLVHLRQLAVAGDRSADELAAEIEADLRAQADARREAMRIKNEQDHAALFGDITTDAAAQERAEELTPA